MNAACQCNAYNKSCSPKILTQFNSEVSVCVFSTRIIKGLETYVLKANGETTYLIVDGEVDGPMSTRTEYDGTKGTAVTKLPADFFTDMDSLTRGNMYGVAIVKAANGVDSEVSCDYSLRDLQKSNNDSV